MAPHSVGCVARATKAFFVQRARTAIPKLRAIALSVQTGIFSRRSFISPHTSRLGSFSCISLRKVMSLPVNGPRSGTKSVGQIRLSQALFHCTSPSSSLPGPLFLSAQTHIVLCSEISAVHVFKMSESSCTRTRAYVQELSQLKIKRGLQTFCMGGWSGYNMHNPKPHEFLRRTSQVRARMHQICR